MAGLWENGARELSRKAIDRNRTLAFPHFVMATLVDDFMMVDCIRAKLADK